MNTFQVLLASNTNAAKHMEEAMDRLKTVFPAGIRFSEVLMSVAVHKDGTSDPKGGQYLNALCLAESNLPLHSIQLSLKEMETDMGRLRGTEAGSQVAIDLDLVVWNDEVLRPWDLAQDFYKDCLKTLKLD